MTNMGATILLDDFSYKMEHQFAKINHLKIYGRIAIKICNSRGRSRSVFYFNARLWHRGGVNNTSVWRHALTFNICRPWMKQRIDIPRLMKSEGVNCGNIDPKALQKLGFMSQTPEAFEEYYAPPAQRSYSQRFE